MAELDPDFEDYRSRWGVLLKLSDRHAAQAFMRGEALKLAGDGGLGPHPGRVKLHLRVNDHGLDCAADPGALPDMVAEWEAFLAIAPPNDPRAYAKQFIIRVLGANRHLDPNSDMGSMAVCAALWLAGPEVVTSLRPDDGTFFCDIAVDHSTRGIRTRIGVFED